MEENSQDLRKAKVYEIGYLLTPTLAEENVAIETGNVKKALEDQGAVFISDEYPKDIELAYTMEKVIANKKEKFDHAYFGWVKFEIEPEALEKVKNSLDGNDSVIRFLIIKTVRENTLSGRRIGGYKKRVKKEEGEAEPINKEEIDKEIDAMVAEEPSASL